MNFKVIITTIFLSFIMVACFSTQKLNVMVYDENAAQDILIGECTRMGLTSNATFKEWFNTEYNNYIPEFNDEEALIENLSDVKITVVMATWCSDSRREVPRFYKILDNLNYDVNKNLRLINVNRQKTTDKLDITNLKIELVPTIIFYRNGVELGRITETPVQSLEKDMEVIVLQ